MDDESLNAFRECCAALSSFVERILNFRELPRCLAIGNLISRSLRVRGDSQEYLNSTATAERYAKMVYDMATLVGLGRFFIELVEVGRGSMQDGPRAAIANIVTVAAKG